MQVVFVGENSTLKGFGAVKCHVNDVNVYRLVLSFGLCDDATPHVSRYLIVMHHESHELSVLHQLVICFQKVGQSLITYIQGTTTV